MFFVDVFRSVLLFFTRFKFYLKVCFKKEVEKQEKKDPDSIKQKDNSRLPSSESSSSSNSSDPKITDQMADLMKPSSPPSTPDEAPAAEVHASALDSSTASATSAQDDDATPPAKKAKKRCGVCKKRLGLTGFECRCGYFYCGIHRYSDKHDCPFDYKKTGRAELSAANPLCAGEKIKKL
jgi:hypothetical protein